MKDKPFFKVETVENKGQKTSEIFLYDEVSEWGVSNKLIAEEIAKIPDDSDIILKIDSPGGSVSHGMTIYNLLKPYKDRLTVEVTGVAASIAAVIAMVGKTVKMGVGAQMMIHGPRTIAGGTIEQLKSSVQRLENIKKDITQIFMTRTGKEESEIDEMLSKDTWMTGQEAVDNGFADLVDNEVMVMSATYDPTNYGFPHEVVMKIEENLKSAKQFSRQGNSSDPKIVQEDKEMKDLLKFLAENNLVKNADVSEGEAISQISDFLKTQNDETVKLKDQLNDVFIAKAETTIQSYVDKGALDADLKDPMVDAFLKDETKTLETLNKLKPASEQNGHEPLPLGEPTLLDTPEEKLESLQEAYAKEEDPKKRASLAKDMRDIRGKLNA